MQFSVDEDMEQLRREREAHEAFAETRRRIYLARPAVLARLDEHALHGGRPLIITGETGAGKSALLAHWSNSWRSRHHHSFILDHYIGVGRMGSTPVGLLRRIMLEIQSFFGLPGSIPDSPDEIIAAFPEWLGSVSTGARIILVIDALNQMRAGERGSVSDGMNHPAELFDWLPAHIPASVSLVVSTTAGPGLEALELRNWEKIEVGLLSDEERRAAFRQYLGNSSSKSQVFEMEQRMENDRLFANPLFLRTSIEEMRVSSLRVSESIAHYHTAGSIDELFDRVLERFELEHGASRIRELATLIWGMRPGSTIRNLGDVGTIPADELSALLDSLACYLVCQGDSVMFFHEQMRHAIEKRYLSGSTSVRELRIRIARFFGDAASMEDRAFHEPWQLRQAAEMEMLRECITDPSLFYFLSNERNEIDLLGYWHAIGPSQALAETYFARFESVGGIDVDLLYMRLGRFLELYGELGAAAASFEKALDLRRLHKGPDHPDSIESAIRLADTLKDLGLYDRAEALGRQAVDIQERRSGVDNITTIACIHTLGGILFTRGQFAEAESLFRRSVTWRESRLPSNDPIIAESYNDLAMAVRSQGNFQEAERLLRRATQICETSRGHDHPATALMLTELASLMGELGRIDEAIAMHRRALGIRESILGPDHLQTAQSYHNLGHLLNRIGNEEEAERFIRTAVRIHSDRLGANHPNTAISVHNLAKILLDRGADDEAAAMLRQALQVFRDLLGSEHPTTIVCSITLAAALIELDRLDEAEQILCNALDISRETVGQLHLNTATSLIRLADLNMRHGRFELCLHQATEALSILEQSIGGSRAHTAHAVALMAYAELACSRREDARRLHDRAAGILASLTGNHRRMTRLLADLKARIDADSDSPAENDHD